VNRDLDRRLARLESAQPAGDPDLAPIRARLLARLEAIRGRLEATGAPLPAPDPASVRAGIAALLAPWRRP
jgi:hypothetical protein